MMRMNDVRTAPGLRMFHAKDAEGRWIHVFPTGRMCSLRGALLMWLVPLFVLVGAVSAAFSYYSYTTMVAQFMDSQMEQLAQSLSAQPAQSVLPSTTPERVHKWGGYVFQVYDANGNLLRSSWSALPANPQTKAGFSDMRLADAPWRVFATELQGETPRRVQVYQSGWFRSHLAAERAGAAIAPVLILLPLALLILWAVAGAMSRAVQEIGREAARQDEHTIAELPLERVPKEIKPLVESFNSLLTRLRDAFATQRRFVQDAAHELRTPITAVALQLENVKRDLPAGACRESFSQLEAGVSRSQRLVDQLLKLSRQEAAPAEVSRTVNLHDQVRESINALIPLADQRNIDLGLAAAAESGDGIASLHCATADLRSVLDNLVENAVRYTPEGGVVDVRVIAGDKPAIEVIDSGPGIPPELLDRVFDRFFRVPGGTARGSGLGLAIAQAAAQRCSLRIVLRNREEASGLIARVEIA